MSERHIIPTVLILSALTTSAFAQSGGAVEGPTLSRRGNSQSNQNGAPSNAATALQAASIILGAVAEARQVRAAREAAEEEARDEALRTAAAAGLEQAIRDARQARESEERREREAEEARQQAQASEPAPNARLYKEGDVVEHITPCVDLYAVTVKDQKPETVGLLNSCNVRINVKFKFDKSYPFSGTYTTMLPGSRSFPPVRAEYEEPFVVLECKFPFVPKSLGDQICLDDSGKK